MGISLSILLFAIGAILTWAVSVEVSGIDLNAVGVILMIVGLVGFVASLIFWSSWGGFGGAPANGNAAQSPQTTVIKDD